MAERLDDGESPPITLDPPFSLPPAQQLPILAVDDRQENLVALRAVLDPLGVPVVTATSGEEALRLVLASDFALILLDVRMPGMGGLETARLIKTRDRSRDVPVIFLTAALDEVEDIVRGYGAGAVDYVVKPFDPELLRIKVSVFIALENSRQALRQSEAFLRSAFEAAPIGKTVLDEGQRIVRANPAFARIVGRSQSALAGVRIATLCHPGDRPALAGLLDRTSASGDTSAASGEQPELDLDLRLLSEDGPIWVAPTASVIAVSDRPQALLLVQWVDVSARRRAEEARAELLLEQAARSQAEAQAERLEKLQGLVEAIESPTLDQLLRELTRRVVKLFDADAAEIELGSGPAERVIVRANGDLVRRLEPNEISSGEERWQEARLTADGIAVGAVRIAMSRGRPLTLTERTLMRDAAERISLVVRRVQLHEEEHRIAVELQRGLLPTRLPSLPGVTIGAHSQAAGLAAEVGGDWYDTFTLPGDRLGVVIGDVTGNGIRAASAMGQLRSATRAFALGDPNPPTPGEVLTRMHRYHETLELDELFTILYVIIDHPSGSAVWASAGHPPPVLRTAGGEVRLLSGAEGMMGIKGVVYEDRRVAVHDGDALVLYTDGLVERRDEMIDVGLARLAAEVREGPADPQELCTHLLRSAPTHEGDPSDDVTVLVVQLTGDPETTAAAGHAATAAPGAGHATTGAPGHAAPGRAAAVAELETTLTPDVHAPRAARTLLARQFKDSMDPLELSRAELAISELVTNAVLHGHGQITLRAQLDEHRLYVEVIDQGTGFERVVRERDFARIGGWGLDIVDADTSRWGMHEGTTHVWFEIERTGPRLGVEAGQPG